MTLAVPESTLPMEAELVAELPAGGGWQYEPKWDGFRCLVFRDGAHVALRSKRGQPLQRYFPEIVEAVGGLAAEHGVLDGELVVPVAGQLSFDDLLQRIHPAASRVARLARDTPALLVVFDLLAGEDGGSLLHVPLGERRARLEAFAARQFRDAMRLRLSPASTDVRQARRWLAASGGALDGVIAKRLDAPYRPGERTMRKIKCERTADCVVGGFRYASGGGAVGSLLLGLYDDAGLLHHVGFCAAFRAAERTALLERLTPLIAPPGFTGSAPGGPSRWNRGRETAWQPLAPRLVVEVRYDHFTAGRFRHGTTLLRWRPDKAPRRCTLDQVARESGIAPLRLLASA